ncbi:MAG: dGTP triphosphohydrolase [Gammaproteobacteria bacterium]
MPTGDDSLAPYAMRSADARGRAHPEPEDPLRGPFELDRHRIIESMAFRRLEHKTQVFAPGLHDHFRTRLTHTLEAVQVARCLAVALRANEALAEAITLAHDLGHPPFGHAGETALNHAMADYGGFNHNAHSVRVVEYMEHPFPDFRGLNLTLEVLAGLRTHATRFDSPQHRQAPSVESQIASIADRVAYDCHDLEDAIGVNFIGLTDLAKVTLWRHASECTLGGAVVKSIYAVRRPVLGALLNGLLGDIVATSRPLLAAISSPEQVRNALTPSVALSATVDRQLQEMERFLSDRVYHHPDVARTDAEGQTMIHALFNAYRRDLTNLPPRFAARIAEQGVERVICDYIAGMTDRFCMTQHNRFVRA